jgi:hypothetical protein
VGVGRGGSAAAVPGSSVEGWVSRRVSGCASGLAVGGRAGGRRAGCRGWSAVGQSPVLAGNSGWAGAALASANIGRPGLRVRARTVEIGVEVPTGPPVGLSWRNQSRQDEDIYSTDAYNK